MAPKAKKSQPKAKERPEKSLQRTTLIHIAPPTVSKIVSGGQTGVDRGALDAAIELGIAHGGWCPRGRLAEDGKIPRKYQLQETDSWRYYIRTQRNVLDSDGTLILYRNVLRGGTALTRTFAQQAQKPLFYIDLASRNAPLAVRNLQTWLRLRRIQTLNVAGPRQSSAPGIQLAAKLLLLAVFCHTEAIARQPKPVK
jgi:hypothetical protein